MEISKTDLIPILKTLSVLEPYLNEIVVIGGWVPLLYRRYGSLNLRHPSLHTRDIDVVVPRKLVESGRPTIDELLLQAGYNTHFYGSDVSPVTKYELSFPAIEVEFLTPEIGRPGKQALTVQHGLTAQTLRYLSILLENTIEIRVVDDFEGSTLDLPVRVPSAAAFVYQKGLTLLKRRAKVAKDLYYIFELLDASQELRGSILSEMVILRRKYASSWFKTFINNLEKYFLENNADGPTLVASQYTGTLPVSTFRLYAQRTFRDFILDLRQLS